MARETRPPRLYESPAFGRTTISSTSSAAPLGSSSFNANRPAPVAGVSLAKSVLLKSVSSSQRKATTPRTTKKKTSLDKAKPSASKRMSSHAAPDAGSGYESDDGGFNITADSGRSLPGSERKQPTKTRKVSGGKSKRAGELFQTVGKGKAREGGGRLMTPPSSQPTGDDDDDRPASRVQQPASSSSYRPLSPQSQPHPSSSRNEDVSTTPRHPPPSTSARAPSLPAQPSPTVAFPSVRRAASHAPISPLKVSALSRSRKRTTSSTLSASSSAPQAPSPNPRARKQPKSALASSASAPVGSRPGFSLSTPVAAPSKIRAAPRTDRPVASKPFHSSSQPMVRKKSTLSQSTSSLSSSRRRSAPPRGLSVLPDDGTPLGSITLPDTPPPPRSPGDDPILLKGKERIRAYVPEEGDESMLMATEEGDDMDLMASVRGRATAADDVKDEEEEHVGDLSMATTMGGGDDSSDDDGEDANITYNPQASPSRPRPSTSSLIAGARSIASTSSLVPTASSSSVASGSGAPQLSVRQSSVPLFSSSVVHSTPHFQRTSTASRPSDPVVSTTPAFPPRLHVQHRAEPTPGGYTPSAYASAIQTPAPALSPYTFQQPGTPESYSGSEDDRDERMFNRERSDSFLADQGGEEAAWAAKIRSSLSPDSSDREDEAEETVEVGQDEWQEQVGDDAGMDFERWDGTEEDAEPALAPAVEQTEGEEEAVEKSIEEEEPVAEIRVPVLVDEAEPQENIVEVVVSPPPIQDALPLSIVDLSSPVPIPEAFQPQGPVVQEEEAAVEPPPVISEPASAISAIVATSVLPSPEPARRSSSPVPQPELQPVEAELEPEQASDYKPEQELEAEKDEEEDEEDQDSFLVVVEQKSLAEEMAAADTPDQSIADLDLDIAAVDQADEQADDSFSEGDLDDEPDGFDSGPVDGSHLGDDEEVDQQDWEDEDASADEWTGEISQVSMLDEEEELYLNESSRDLLEAAGLSFFSTVTSPSPIKLTAPISSPSKAFAAPSSSSTPARRVPTPFATASAIADRTQDYVVVLNDVSHDSIEVEDQSFVSTSTTYDSPSLPRGTVSGATSRPALKPKRLSLQTIGQLDAFFKDRAGSLSPSVGSASDSPRFSAFPVVSTAAASGSVRASSVTSFASGSQDHQRRASVASSTQSHSDRPATSGLYPSLADVMMRKQQMMAGEGGGDVSVRERSAERDESFEEETYIKISSNDPREAARATAFLKMFHDYVEPDPSTLDPNSSFTSSHSRKSLATHFPTPNNRRPIATPGSRRRRSSNTMGDVSMMSAPELLMEAEQEIAAEIEGTTAASSDDDESEEEAEESFAIPGSFEPVSVLETAKGPKKDKKGKGKQRASLTRDRAWGTTEWRTLMSCLDDISGGRKHTSEVDEDAVVDAFLAEMGLVERDLEGEWIRSKLHTRIASILQRRENEHKLGVTPSSRRRRSHHPHKAFISPNKAAGNMSLGSIATPRSPVRQRRAQLAPAAAAPAKRRTSLAGKVLGFLGGWLAPTPAPEPEPVMQERRKRADAPVVRRPRSPPLSRPREPEASEAVVPRQVGSSRPVSQSRSQPQRDPFTSTPTPAVAPVFTPAPPTIIPPSSPLTHTTSSRSAPSFRNLPSSVAVSHSTPSFRSLPLTNTSKPSPIPIPTSKPIAIPRATQPRPRQSHARSPVKVSELVRSFESVRSLGEEEQERVRELERKGSGGSLRGE